MAAMVSKKAEQGQDETIPTACKLDHPLMMVVAVVLPPRWSPTPGPTFKHTTINTHTMGQNYVAKTRRSHHY